MRQDVFLQDEGKLTRDVHDSTLTLNSAAAPYATVPDTTAVICQPLRIIQVVAKTLASRSSPSSPIVAAEVERANMA